MIRNLIVILICCLGVVACKSPEARKPVQSKSGSFIQESAVRNKRIYEMEKAIIEKMMKVNSENDYLASDSGFWYYYNTKIDTLNGDSPSYGDHITFSYDIKDLSGNEILSEEEIGLQNYKIDQTNQDLISGLRDGLKLMKEGETVTFLFPSYKAYGYYGIVNKLGTNIPVQSKVTLKSIEQTQEN
ncbi:gliding motility-associated peptidyl-prolyl isomerase GldI [Ulvibacter antarcticus]|uniref:Peptidyl-prolyl cis-trans isomerase n=1 Tax=Ulvibacter antarcticus TaxID=442714 RepID=A0A3L9YDS5_9FLAO|nr:gliding motility-associated peptidyl-prolyl isomerase GldI [Ulvibacter antarcticus]RMA58604.1 protein involved in gliding motility GldI [Ulvibacter antarcticus]